MVTTTGHPYTVDEFLTLPDELADGCELIDARILRKPIPRIG